MTDSDGPIIARKVYQALFEPTDNPQYQAFLERVSKLKRSNNDGELSSSTLDDIKSAFRSANFLPMYSLAETIDDIVRHLRMVEKLPADQWATFVHVGI